MRVKKKAKKKAKRRRARLNRMTPTGIIFTDLEVLGVASAAAAAAMLYVLRFFSFKVRLQWNHLWRLVRWAFQTFILRKNIARQRYHIAALENADPHAVFRELVLLGYQPNYFAFCDPGELYNLRRLRFRDGELWQDHVRVFPDEVRGHSEISYEEDAALHAQATTIEALPVLTQQALRWAIHNVRLNATQEP